MSTQLKQTQQEIEQAVNQWLPTKHPLLANTARNGELVGNYVATKWGVFTVGNINQAIIELGNRLDWLREPATEAPSKRKGDMFQRLAEVGVLKSPHMSRQEVEDQQAHIRNEKQAFLDRAHLLREQSVLQQEKLEAETATVQNLRFGVTDHYRTGELRKKKKAAVAAKIEHHNERCRRTGNDNLTITI